MSAPVDVVPPPPARPAAARSACLLCVAVTAVSVLIAGHWAGRAAACDCFYVDLWIYSSGAWLAMHGQTPYDAARIHERVAERWPDDVNLDGNSGFFLTPQALLVMAPFAVLPWGVAKAVWSAGMVATGAAVGWLLKAVTDVPLPGWFTAAAVAAVMLNPLSLFVLLVGQTTLLVLGCVVGGQAAYRRGWERIGCLLWAAAFLKPHIAMPLLPLAYLLGGWRRAAEVMAWAAGLNVLAGVAFFGDPFYTLEYLRYVQHGHQSVTFNRVAVNPQITGWNRLLVAAGGPAFELGMAGTVAGYAVFAGAVAGRVRMGNWVREKHPAPEVFRSAPVPLSQSDGECGERSESAEGSSKSHAAWLTAVAACGMLTCCQLLPYELPLLVLVLPYLGELLTTGRRRDAVAAAFTLSAAAFAMLPGGEASDYYRTVRGLFEPIDHVTRVATGFPLNVTDVLLSHRCLGVLAVTAVVFFAGPPARPRPIPPPAPGRQGVCSDTGRAV